MSAERHPVRRDQEASSDALDLDRVTRRALEQFAGILAEIALAVASDGHKLDMKGGEKHAGDADD